MAEDEAPPGFEPGMADLQSAGATPQRCSEMDVAATPVSPLAHTLAREVENRLDLARVIGAWPTLSGAIRKAILALVQSATE